MEMAIYALHVLKVIKNWYSKKKVSHCKHTNEIRHLKNAMACTIRTVNVTDILWFFF